MWKTEVVKSWNGGHQVRLTIDHQSFLFEEKFSEEGMTSRKYAEWHKSMIDVAINRLLRDGNNIGAQKGLDEPT